MSPSRTGLSTTTLREFSTRRVVCHGISRITRGRGLRQQLRAVELAWRLAGFCIRETGKTELVRRLSRLAPGNQVGRSADGINARRPEESKLKSPARSPARRNQLDCERISDNRNSLALQQRHCFGQ